MNDRPIRDLTLEGVEVVDIGARPAHAVEAELADLARLIDRADAEASRLRRARLRAWQDARAAGLSWRAIAAASGGMDHAQIAKTVGRSGAKAEGLGAAKTVGKLREGTD